MSTPYRLTQFLNANNPSGFATQEDLQLFALQLKDVVDTLSTLSILNLKALFPHLMAQAIAINGKDDTLVNLTFVENANLLTHTPFFAIAVYKTGEITDIEMALNAQEIRISPLIQSSSTGFSSVNQKQLIILDGLLAIKSDIENTVQVRISVNSSTDCTFDVYVFGVEI